MQTTICHLCGQQGHRAPWCPSTTCTACGKSGHKKNVCPEPRGPRSDQHPARQRRGSRPAKPGTDISTNKSDSISSLDPNTGSLKAAQKAPRPFKINWTTAKREAVNAAPSEDTRASTLPIRHVRSTTNVAEKSFKFFPSGTLNEGLSRNGQASFDGSQAREELARIQSERRQGSRPASAVSGRGSESDILNREEELYDDRQVRQELARIESQRRREQKFASDAPPPSLQSSEALRGRDRDKSRRRRQFVKDYDEEGDLGGERAELKRQRKREKAERAAAPVPLMIPPFISLNNLARLLKIRPEDFGRKLESLGFEELTYDHVFNAETAGLIAMEYNFTPMLDESESQDLRARPAPEDKSVLPPRPPVVTIMGHVDHGKTTLLDWLRKSSVAASEHGGITQHIGAFSVPMPLGKIITFLDTPGHAAFLSMRQRGANVTDIVILVVAADDSVKPQTIEAIKHAKDAQVPIIVAVNKIDREEANVERVKQDLARHGVDVEDFGGDTQVVQVSGKTGQGMAELEEAVVTLSEILDMRAEEDGAAEGWVLEASKRKEGRVATVLVRRGTIRPGSFIVAGSTWARIRTLKNEAGLDIDAARPGTPVEVGGWREQPQAGDEVLQASDEARAKEVVAYRAEAGERQRMAGDMEAVNDSRRLEQEKRQREEGAAKGKEVDTSETESGPKEMFFIVKGDVSGSVEAVLNSVSALGNQEVRPHVLRSGVGPISEFDIEHAAAASGHVISFNTTVEGSMLRQAEAHGVSILDHNIIYRLVDDVKAKLSEMLPPSVTQRVTGEAEIAQIFDINIKGRTKKPFAGCKVRNGVMARGVKARVMRRGELVYRGRVAPVRTPLEHSNVHLTGLLASLKNVKKDVTEMRKGSECGMGFDGWDDFALGDQVQCYEEKVERRFL